MKKWSANITSSFQNFVQIGDAKMEMEIFNILDIECRKLLSAF